VGTPETPLRPEAFCFRCGARVVVSPSQRGAPLCPACAKARAAALAAPIELSPLELETHRAPCLKCGEPQRVGVPTCTKCGHTPGEVPLSPDKAREVLGDFDEDPDATAADKRERQRTREERARVREQQRLKDAAKREASCSGCGYSLKGLKGGPDGVTCPECGVVTKVYARSDHHLQTSLEIARSTVRKPLLFLAVGVPGVALLSGAQGWIVGGMAGSMYGFIGTGPKGGLVEAAANAGLGLLWLGIAWVVATVTLFVCGLVWTGVNTTFRLMSLQTAGLMSIASLTFLLLSAVPLPIPVWVIASIAGIVYAWQLSDAQDLYAQDAAIVTGLTGFVLVMVRLGAGLF